MRLTIPRPARGARLAALLALGALLTALTLSAPPAHAAQDAFTVASEFDLADGDPGDGDCDPNDDGSEADCTLRAALEEADAQDAEGERHEIGFSGVMTIQPATALPEATERVAIDNTSGSECDTAPSEAVVLDGQDAVPRGLRIDGQKSLVCGLVVRGFTESGIYVSGAQTVVGQSRIGTDVAGSTGFGNFYGVRVAAAEVVLESNLISDSLVAGVRIDPGAADTAIHGNLIGTDAAGTADLGNGTGILIADADGTVVGGDTAAERNVVSGNSFGILSEAGAGVRIEGNYIGTTVTGNAALPNSNEGVQVDGGSVTVGGSVSAPAQATDTCDDVCNVIAGNNRGVKISSGSGSVAGNHIGVNSLGVGAVGQSTGVWIQGTAQDVTVGGTSAARRNSIAGNATAVRISGEDVEGAEVLGNHIGLGPDGALGIGNTGVGVVIAEGAAGNAIGAAGAGNAISASATGVLLNEAGAGNTIQANKIGLDAAGTLPRPNSGNGIRLMGGTAETTIGGAAPGEGNVISANGQGGIEIFDADETSVLGNYLGPDASGAAVPGEQDFGVDVASGAGNVIGGASPGAGNVISGNEDDGIWLHGAENEGTQVLGNQIGLAADGDTALGNGFNGVSVGASVAGASVGGADPGEGNVISANGTAGIRLDGMGGTEVLGNHVGTDATGLEDRGNGDSGIVVFEPGAVVGAPGAGNVIAGNDGRGISLSSALEPTIQANLIGLGADGEAPLGNEEDGIYGSNVDGATIGGDAAGEGNTISANGDNGLDALLSDELAVEGNRIGTTADGTAPRGNAGNGIEAANSDEIELAGNLVSANAEHGILLEGSAGTDDALVEGNTIAANEQDGIAVTGAASSGNRLLGNSIDGNGDEPGDVGIDLLGTAGVSDNDPLDEDVGPNRGQNYPVLTTAETVSGQTEASGALATEPEGEYLIELFASPACDESGHGEGATPLGSTEVATDSEGDAEFEATVAGAPGEQLTATATDLGPDADGTSEFSACLPIEVEEETPGEDGSSGSGSGSGSGASGASAGSPAASAPPPPLAGVAPGALARVLGRVAPVRGRRALLRLGCAAGGAPCRGALRLAVVIRVRKGKRVRRRMVTVGRAGYALAPGAQRRLGVRLNRRGARLLRRRGKRGLRVRALGPDLVARGLKLKQRPRR